MTADLSASDKLSSIAFAYLNKVKNRIYSMIQNITGKLNKSGVSTAAEAQLHSFNIEIYCI